ncbi:head completion/stabilization protein [Stenotrophomonas sp. SAU14A_NAIMI4_5]|uniref:head completion/stabilization protein n=1 Tax=Stenotrophomonas sp. SAU14A_NAIMI4_5 TaxID=2072413 RepID=UPI000D53DFA8|nr:head completion/stabilization protein [Stenotrophomonas sp. SAU14A_NAIMI4_5]AWH47953.1 head completion/stabilization protein [Stenotrophomonas sp. SAU14A_NAIMI4_5]
MSAFIAPGKNAPSDDITSGSWWPSISPSQVREDMRITGTVTEARLRSSLINAVTTVNTALVPWAQRQMAEGHESLAGIPADAISGVSCLVLLYRRAVATYAAAELTERYRSYDATDSANQRADDLTPSIGEIRRDHRWAMRDLQGLPRTTVDLI